MCEYSTHCKHFYQTLVITRPWPWFLQICELNWFPWKYMAVLVFEQMILSCYAWCMSRGLQEIALHKELEYYPWSWINELVIESLISLKAMYDRQISEDDCQMKSCLLPNSTYKKPIRKTTATIYLNIWRRKLIFRWRWPRIIVSFISIRNIILGNSGRLRQ